MQIKPAEHQQWITQVQVLQDLLSQTHKHFPSHKPDPQTRPTLRSHVAIQLRCSNSNLHHAVEQHISSVLVLFSSITCSFTGANGLQRGDSGLSRSESLGSVKPDPRAKPFVPPPSLAAKLSAKQGDGWGSDSGSVKSDASGASGGGTQAFWMPASKPQGIQGDIVKSVDLTLSQLKCPECSMWCVTSFLGTVWLISGGEQIAI